MDHLRKIWNLFLYAGIEKDEYYRLLPAIRKENENLLNVFSQIGAIMFSGLFVASLITNGFVAVNGPPYMISCITMLVILLCVQFFTSKCPWLVTLLVYVFEVGLYVFGIYISMLHAEKPAVSAVAFLLVSPLLFYDRPIRSSAITAVVVAVFCVIVDRLKEPHVAESDMWNMISFGVVSVITTVFMMSVKYRAQAQSRQIAYMGQTDLLTGVKNRNYFESQMQVYPDRCESGLICVYADVNGLHETNNKEGHEAGDRMLRSVAGEMQRTFGWDDTYRIGGDEFVGFKVDGDLGIVSAEVDLIKRNLEAQGYYVAFGIAGQDKSPGALNVQELVKEAESRMFDAKREYYSDPEHNRRNR